jgi:hypothetical protein
VGFESSVMFVAFLTLVLMTPSLFCISSYRTSPSPGLKMYERRSYELSISTYKIIRCHSRQDHNLKMLSSAIHKL